MRAQAGKQDVRVGIPIVVVDPPATAENVHAIPAQVVHGTDPRLDIVRVFPCLIAKLLEARNAVEPARRRRRGQCNVVRHVRLVEVEAGNQVIAEADIDGQAIVHPPVILNVEPVLVHRQIRRCTRLVACDEFDRAIHVVKEMPIGVVGAAGRERDVQPRLVDVVHAGLEIVPKASHARYTPGEIVLELELALFRRLRRVGVVPDGGAVRERFLRLSCSCRDDVAKVSELEDELVQLSTPDDPVVVHVKRIELVFAIAPVFRYRLCVGAVYLRVRVAAVANREELLRRYLHRRFPREQGLAHRCRVDTVQVREQSARSDGLRRVLLRPLRGGEEMRAILDDRPTHRSAVLVAAIVLLLEVSDFFPERLRVHTLVAEVHEAAAGEVVGTALGHDIHHATVAAAEFGLVTLRDEVELLDRLEREELQQAADGIVVVVAAVDLVIDVATVAARDLR